MIKLTDQRASSEGDLYPRKIHRLPWFHYLGDQEGEEDAHHRQAPRRQLGLIHERRP